MPKKAEERWLLPVVVDRSTACSILPIEASRLDGRTVRSLFMNVASLLWRASIAMSAVAVLAVAISSVARAEIVAPPRVDQVRLERAFELRGELTATLALDLQAALQAGFRRVVVTSRGGEVLVARAMADLLNRHEAVLVAQGQCHSACTYLWLATKRRALGKGADLALHATFDNFGPNDFGELWLKELGCADLMRWARGPELHHLTPQELEPGTCAP